jgi:hypothetical protein
MGKLDVKRLNTITQIVRASRYWLPNLYDHRNSSILNGGRSLSAAYSRKARTLLQPQRKILSGFPALPGQWGPRPLIYGCAPTGARILTAGYFHWLRHCDGRRGSLRSDSRCLLSRLNVPGLRRSSLALLLLPRPLAHARRRPLLALRRIVLDSSSLRGGRADTNCSRR